MARFRRLRCSPTTLTPSACMAQVRVGTCSVPVHPVCLSDVCASRFCSPCIPTSTPTSTAAGTALGDPIELGAALAVLRRSNAALRLAAAKSRVGHSEPASGAVGVTHAAAQLEQAASSVVLHLRSFNPLLVSIAQAHTAAGCAAPWVPRQQGPGQLSGTSSSTAQQTASGVSAFAFQGTNAHAVLVTGSTLPGEPPLAGSQWQRRRFWFAPPPHALAHNVSAATSATVRLQAALQAPAMAYLWDHKVQGQPLLPGAAMFEAAAAAGLLLLPSIQAAAAAGPVLAGVSIPAPCVLPAHGSRPAEGPALAVAVELVTGRLTLRSASAAHLAGAFVHGTNTFHGATADASRQQLALGLCSAVLAPLLTGRMHEGAASQPLPGAVAWVQERSRSQAGQYQLHPAVIDNATQVSTAQHLQKSGVCVPQCTAVETRELLLVCRPARH